MLIAICGMDGSGKTTQLNLLKKNLEISGYEVYITKQPTNWYRKDRRLQNYLEGHLPEDKLLLRELALFSAADRLRHYQTEIYPNESAGKIVISDRYVFTTYAYFMARGIGDLEWLKSINKFIPLPDITIYLDVPAEIALNRIIKREGISRKKEEKDFDRLNTIRQFFKSQPWGKMKSFYVLNGTQETKTIEKQINDILFANGIKFKNNLGEH